MVDDDVVIAPEPSMHGTVRGLVNAIATLRLQSALPFLEPFHFDDAGWVANRWCEILPIPMAAKQRLMELEDPVVRLRLVDEFLRSKGVVVVGRRFRLPIAAFSKRFSGAGSANAELRRRRPTAPMPSDASAGRRVNTARIGCSVQSKCVNACLIVACASQRTPSACAARANAASSSNNGKRPQSRPHARRRALLQPHATAPLQPQPPVLALARARACASSPDNARVRLRAVRRTVHARGTAGIAAPCAMHTLAPRSINPCVYGSMPSSGNSRCRLRPQLALVGRLGKVGVESRVTRASTRLTLPSRIAARSPKQNAAMAAAVERPMPGKRASSALRARENAAVHRDDCLRAAVQVAGAAVVAEPAPRGEHGVERR